MKIKFLTLALLALIFDTMGQKIVVTSPNTNVSWTPGSQRTIRWNRGGTLANQFVDISLSTDGGLTFQTVLISNTPNDQAQLVTLPFTKSNTCKVRIALTNNTAADTSDVNFRITGFCSPILMSCTTASITNITMNTMDKNSTCSAGAYSTTGGVQTSVIRSASYPFSVTTTSATANIGAWIDFNNDQDFDDVGEFLYGSTIGALTHNATISIPASAPTGSRRMRVRAIDGAILTSTDACTNLGTQGETEDFNVTITNPTIAVDASFSLTAKCPGTSITVPFTVTNLGTGTLNNLQFDAVLFRGASSTILGGGSASPIQGNIPQGATAATGYRTRIVTKGAYAVNGTQSGAFQILAATGTTPTGTAGFRCGTGSVNLSASGCGTYQWFSSGIGSTQIGGTTTSTSFATPSISANTNFYVACVNTTTGCAGPRTAVGAGVKNTPVIGSVTPLSGTVDVTQVTITGSFLEQVDSVKFNGKKVLYSYNSSTGEIKATVPIGATTGPIQLFSECGQTNSATFTVVVPNIARPVASPAGGSYGPSQNVTLTCATPGVTIYYTQNGNNPLIGSSFTKIYDGTPIFQGVSGSIRAIGYRNGWTTSPIMIENYTITSPTVVATPTISPIGGTYTSAKTITLSTTTPGATIWYTTNGAIPSPGNVTTIKYLRPFSISDPFVTVRTLATKDGFATIGYATAFYFLSGVQFCAAPTFNPPPSTYSSPQSVTISSATPGATIYYTMDGTTPSPQSVLAKIYSGPVNISSTRPILAAATKTDFGTSPEVTGYYTITGSSSQGSSRFGVSKAGEAMGLNVYPNPSNGEFLLELKNPATKASVTITDMLGKVVYQQEYNEESLGYYVKMQNASKGIYLMRVQTDLGSSEQRIVVE